MLEKLSPTVLTHVASYLTGGLAILQRLNHTIQERSGFELIPLPYEYTLDSVDCMSYFDTPLVSWGKSVCEIQYFVDLALFDSLLYRLSRRTITEDMAGDILRYVKFKCVGRDDHPLLKVASYYNQAARDAVEKCVQFSDLDLLPTVSVLCGLSYILKLAVVANNWVVIDWIASQSDNMVRFYLTVAMQAVVCGNRPMLHWCLGSIRPNHRHMQELGRIAAQGGQTDILDYLLSIGYTNIIQYALLSANTVSIHWALELCKGSGIVTLDELMDYHTDQHHTNAVEWIRKIRN